MNLMYEEEINVDFYENILNNKEYTKNEKPEMIKSGDMKKQKRGGSIDLE